MTDAAVETFEFASPEWVACIGQLIVDGLEDVDLDGIEWSMCEEFTDPPAHLLQPGEATIGWYARITGGVVEVGRGILESTFKVTADYATVLPIARAVMAGNDQAARDAEAAFASGAITTEGDRSLTPLPFAKLDVHDRIAIRTR